MAIKTKKVFKNDQVVPGIYHIFVKDEHLYTCSKAPMSETKQWAAFWYVNDILNNKQFGNFVSLKECKDFIKSELLKD